MKKSCRVSLPVETAKEMRRLALIILSATASLAFGGEEKAVDVGSFDYRGRSFVNAKAVVVSPNEVKVDGVSIPWDKLNPSVQFRLKPMREKVIAQQAKIDLTRRGLRPSEMYCQSGRVA